MTVAPGTRLGVYEVLGLLGAGGMGEVYEARDTRLERDVAVKVLASELAADPETLSRFEREAKAVAALNHPNIVTLYSVEEVGGLRFLVMERIRGRALSEIVERGGLPVPRILELAVPIAEALGAAHERGVVHRDLKPGNVMVTEDGRVKILDFGLARLHVQPSAPPGAESAAETLTKAGHVFGTIPYISPEQLKGERADGRADIFAFGAMLYEMATGDRPFQGKSAAELVSAILKEDPAPLEERRPDLPPAFSRIVRRCLEKDLRRRSQSAIDLSRELRELAEALRTGTTEAREVSTAGALQPARGSRRLRLLFAAVVLLVAGAAAFLALRRVGASSRPAPIRSLAVLPFANLSRDPGQDYFVEGMHDALITELAKLGAFDVTSRGSVIRYRGSTKPLKQIAEELGVDALIEGSALRAGNRVRITAQLIRGTTDKHLWAQTYDRELQDVLALLAGVSHAIAGEVQATVARGNRPFLPAEPTAQHRVRPEAWDAHLKARQVMLSGPQTPADFFKLRELHQRSVDLDPEFAEGWTGVGLANLLLGFFRGAPVAEVIPKAREAATKALSLDDRAGGAYGVLGTIDLYFDWNFESAKARLERAVALDPHSVLTRHAWADYLMVTGRFEESLAQVKLGKVFEPASPLAHAVVLFHGMATHRYEEFAEEGRRSAALFPNSGPIHSFLGDLYWRQGKYQEALAEFEKSSSADEGDRLLRSELVRAGPVAALKATAHFYAAQARTGGGRPLAIAALYAEAGEREPAFEWLDKAYAERTPQLLHIVADPAFDQIRDDPRYADLIRRIGIPLATSTPAPTS